MWDSLIVNPMINALLFFYNLLNNNFILAIAVFTILIRVITLPLNMRQQRSMMRTQEMQPQIQAIQKKYRDNPQKMQEEFKKLGYNPADTLTGCLPTLIQFPILIGLYQAITIILSSTPQSLFELVPRVNTRLIDLTPLIPVQNKFLWMNLSQPDPYFVLPIVVFASMFIQQKLLSPAPSTQNQQDNPMASMTQSMQYTMPLMFGFFSLQFPSGLSIYFILANIIGIFQGLYMRRITDREKAERAASGKTAPVVIDAEESKPAKATGTKPKPSANGANPAKNKSTSGQTSRRKKRSAKR
jgi:YidC/Oxa1 family membrane protein insertase